jgi:hypothetical protein
MSPVRYKGLEEGQLVSLYMADLAPTDGRIDVLDDGYAIIGLATEPEPSLEVIGEVEAVIEAPGVRGLARLMGTMRQHRGRADAVRVDFDDGPEVIQRRQFVRIETNTGITVVRADGTRDRTHSINLSGAGLLLAGPADLAMEEAIVMDIEIGPEDPPIHARGRVVRETRSGYKGVRLALIEEGDRDRLIHFVFEQQRLRPRVKVR